MGNMAVIDNITRSSQHTLSRTSTIIGKQNEEDRKKVNNTIKVLLLGLPESGKSTLIKQLSLIYFQENSERDKMISESTVSLIRSFIVHNLYKLYKFSFEENFYKIQSENLITKSEFKTKQAKMKNINDVASDKYFLKYLKDLWQDEGIQKNYREKRRLMGVQNNLPHFMNRFHIIFGDNYKPSIDDWLLVSNMRGNGVLKKGVVMESSFTIDKIKYKLIDISGQLRDFKVIDTSNINYIIWFISIDEYNEVIEGNNKINMSIRDLNRILKLFNSEHIKIFIFLNKIDLFKENLKYNKVSKYFNTYSGVEIDKSDIIMTEDKYKQCYKQAVEFFRDKILEDLDSKRNMKRIVNFYEICTMDQHSVKTVMKKIAKDVEMKRRPRVNYVKNI